MNYFICFKLITNNIYYSIVLFRSIKPWRIEEAFVIFGSEIIKLSHKVKSINETDHVSVGMVVLAHSVV